MDEERPQRMGLELMANLFDNQFNKKPSFTIDPASSSTPSIASAPSRTISYDSGVGSYSPTWPERSPVAEIYTDVPSWGFLPPKGSPLGSNPSAFGSTRLLDPGDKPAWTGATDPFSRKDATIQALRGNTFGLSYPPRPPTMAPMWGDGSAAGGPMPTVATPEERARRSRHPQSPPMGAGGAPSGEPQGSGGTGGHHPGWPPQSQGAGGPPSWPHRPRGRGRRPYWWRR
jgi:hypothetical protein